MDLKTYLRQLHDDEARAAFARRCGTTLGHLRNCIYVEGKRIATAICAQIERETLGAVPCETLRDDLAWVRIADAEWPWHPAGRPLLDVAAVRLPAPIEQAA